VDETIPVSGSGSFASFAQRIDGVSEAAGATGAAAATTAAAQQDTTIASVERARAGDISTDAMATNHQAQRDSPMAPIRDRDNQRPAATATLDLGARIVGGCADQGSG
jgi:hypothetical protein